MRRMIDAFLVRARDLRPCADFDGSGWSCCLREAVAEIDPDGPEDVQAGAIVTLGAWALRALVWAKFEGQSPRPFEVDAAADSAVLMVMTSERWDLAEYFLPERGFSLSVWVPFLAGLVELAAVNAERFDPEGLYWIRLSRSFAQIIVNAASAGGDLRDAERR